ncbi:putative 2-aminoethylphosphonate ABC transporter permease subunit [Methylobacterium oryzihabitans]|uniref:Putative 2-aminoethylphosphonate ABC transporter permease subunit n=1 Tax=Methylobacterium oryzihabitans TaxID=2499852 RepID=A0A3S2V402_9HYPH|nr:putative 2-aminoethylphosphonate ABC transporter permease subunit [Methylobacterium oryzihabitans]RVU14956.1 putative 2-aminoethylphosphonate ABC transporter permease subunit [Methylobacterium oryzihabitans]
MSDGAITLPLDDTGAPASARRRIPEAAVAAGLVAALGLLLVLIIALPLGALLVKSVEGPDGRFAGLANFRTYFATSALVDALANSLLVASLAVAVVVPLAFGYAYALTRTAMPFKGLFLAAALLPIFAPSLLSGIALTYILGNQGFLRGLLFGHSVYGPIGIVIAECLYAFPHALLILTTALALADGRLYEAAAAMGTSRLRTFATVTLPGARYGLVSAGFVVFTLVVTDFGIPKVIGGQYSVLATDAYRQVVGQQNFPMGAVVGLLMLVPAVLAFAVDRVVQRRQSALLSARSVPYEPLPRRLRDRLSLLFAVAVAGVVVGTYGVAVWASFIRYWPYNLALTLDHYDFAATDADGWQPYRTSLAMAGTVAVIGTVVVFAGAYLIEKLKVFPAGRMLAQLLAMLPLAVPGLVLGLGYVFFFNAPWNPLDVLYGSLALLAVNTLAHYYTVAHVTATTALKQIDPEFEAVSASLKVPFWRTFTRVSLPICLPTVLELAVYLFVNAMTTVSAVIFLYGPDTKLASIAIVHMDEAGTTASAAAMASVIMATALAARLGAALIGWGVVARLQRWRRREA